MLCDVGQRNLLISYLFYDLPHVLILVEIEQNKRWVEFQRKPLQPIPVVLEHAFQTQVQFVRGKVLARYHFEYDDLLINCLFKEIGQFTISDDFFDIPYIIPPRFQEGQTLFSAIDFCAKYWRNFAQRLHILFDFLIYLFLLFR